MILFIKYFFKTCEFIKKKNFAALMSQIFRYNHNQRVRVLLTKVIFHCLHLKGGSSNKAKLISRMAKMGQPMLPLVGAVPAQQDSDEEQVMVGNCTRSMNQWQHI